jgi:hypothetical protein
MKKLLLIAIFAIGNFMCSYAQNDTVLYIENCQASEDIYICLDNYTIVNIYAETGCTGFRWYLNGQERFDNPLTIECQYERMYEVEYRGCNIPERTIWPYFRRSRIPNSFTHAVYKRNNETERLEAVGIDSLQLPFRYEFLWSTGETTSGIDVTEPGTYTCEVIDQCGSAIRTFIVQDNVELYRATVDLETNLNKATWQVTAEQAEYISEVKVYRDGLLVGTAPYEQGYFLDAIGSDNAARNYHIVGVSTEGEDCPIASYEKGTIHTTYYQDVNGNLNMTWNIPYVEEGAQGTLTYFQICKYDPANGDLTVVDQVNSSITDYTCGVNQFEGGQAVIAAVFSDNKSFEELSFSNLTTDILVGIWENGENAFSIYPNPANDCVTIEGTGILIVTNTIGQTIMTKEIDGKATIELPRGMYFVKMNGITRKIVVE